MARNTQEHLQPSANALSPARLENQIKSTCNLYQTNHTRALINAIHWTDDHNKISFYHNQWIPLQEHERRTNVEWSGWTGQRHSSRTFVWLVPRKAESDCHQHHYVCSFCRYRSIHGLRYMYLNCGFHFSCTARHLELIEWLGVREHIESWSVKYIVRISKTNTIGLQLVMPWMKKLS